MNKTIWLATLAFLGAAATAFAQVPGIIQYQGRVTSNGTNFTGAGQFKFAIIETAITGDSLWSNDGTSVMGAQPTKEVSVPVQDGLFIVGLGDNSLGNMTVIPASIFAYENLKLRIWFSDGVGPFAALSPDQRITSVGFAMMAAGLAPNTINASHILDGAITGGKIAPDAVAGVNLLNQTITGSKIAPNSVTSAEIGDSIQMQRLTLGGALWDGDLRLNALGLGEMRGQLLGDSGGSHLNLLFLNSSTGAVLSARAPGARLNLWDSFGNQTTALGVGLGGGELSLFQMNGQVGIFLDADKSLYGNPNSSGAEMELRSGSGDLGVLLDGQGTGSSGELRLYNTASNALTVQILGAETSSTGAELRLRNAAGVNTVVFDAENDAEGGPRVDLNKGDGTSTMVFVPGGTDVTLGGGGLMRLGEIAGNNLGIDGDEIVARTNGAAAPLRLNYGYTAPVAMSRVTIGTLTPATGYELSVNGQIICEELVVQNSNDWPDYVFADDYPLMPLEEVEANIKKNKHLPGIPSAKKIGADGIPLGEIQRQMMEKIEELTLHLIQQNKRLATQEEELARLRSRVNAAK